MASLKLVIDPLWYGSDNTQKRQVVQGTVKYVPDTPGGTTYTYKAGGIRITFEPLEVIKASTMIPQWVEIKSLNNPGTTYLWTPGAIVTNVEIDDNELTVTAKNNFEEGDHVTFSYLTGPAGEIFNNWGLGVSPHAPVIVTESDGSEFEAKVGVETLASSATMGLAIPVKYRDAFPPPLPPTLPALPPMGNVKIIKSGAEVTTIASGDRNDVILFRAEFMRSYN